MDHLVQPRGLVVSLMHAARERGTTATTVQTFRALSGRLSLRPDVISSIQIHPFQTPIASDTTLPGRLDVRGIYGYRERYKATWQRESQDIRLPGKRKVEI